MTTVAPEVERLKARLRRQTLDGTEFFVAEGDLLLSEPELEAYAQSMADTASAPVLDVRTETGATKLLVVAAGGKPVRWAPGVALSYYVAKETFTPAQYVDVRANVVAASEDWMSTCGVEFRHLADLDDGAPAAARAAALFDVRFIDASGAFIAAAFFPNQPPFRRHLVIDPSYFASGMDFNMVGVLRHELGHVLGFRHEHIRSGAPAVCQGETLNDAIEVTDYDPQSVMHYFCGGVGSKDLKITTLDVAGAHQLYGAPLSNFTLVRP